MFFIRLFIRTCALLMLFLPALLCAQTTVGTVYGSVSDITGARVPGATLTLTNTATHLTTAVKSDTKGLYTFIGVKPGNYTVSATADGFASQTQVDLTVDANENTDASFKLSTGSASENVDVVAGTSMVDTRESQIGETIDERRIDELPTLNRDPYQLLQTVTGVTSFVGDIVTGSRAGANFSVNGFPANTSSFYLDGAQNNAMKSGGGNKAPTAPALQEFRILTANFDAEFGRSPGGVVNLITKSGGAHYHGELYEFLRNNMFDAKNYFAPSYLRPNFKQHQFGGVVGGPIPRSTKSFFFTSFEHLQLHQNSYIYPALVILPTAAEANGDFRNAALPVNSTVSCNGVQGVICQNDIDPVANSVIKFIPQSDPATGLNPTQAAQADNLVNQGLMRIDYAGFRNHSIEATFFDSRGSNATPTAGSNQVFGYAGMYNDENQMNGIVADNWIINNRFFNSLRFFYTDNKDVITNEHAENLLQNLGAQIPTGGPIAAPPAFALGVGVLTAGSITAGPNNSTQQALGVVDVANATLGRHSIKFGGSYVWDKYAEDGGNTAGGYYVVSNATGNPYADFLMGRANSFSQSSTAIQRKHNYDPALFMQDTWHALSRLSLNLGVRWEMYVPFQGYGFYGNSGTFRAGVQSTVFPSAPLGVLYQGDAGVAPGVTNVSMTRFAPRVGFAYDVYGDGKTSLRGGFGMFFYQEIEDDEGLRIQQPYGLALTELGITSYANPFIGNLGVSPFPYPLNATKPTYTPGAIVYAQPPGGNVSPYAEEYNLTVEQQLSPTYALHVSYVGSNYMKQLLQLDINTPTLPASTTSVTPYLSRRPYEPYGIPPYNKSGFYFQQIYDQKNANNLHYNSLQVTLRGKLGRKIDLNTSYVWSKALDFESPVDQTNVRSGYGASGLDLRHRFVLSGLFALPETRHLGWFGKQVLDGWRLNDITYIQSGTPFTVTSGTDENGDGVNSDYPNVIGNPYTRTTSRADRILHYLNPAAFAVPTGPQAFYGNEQRNQLYLPATTQTNVAFFKEFALPSETRLAFRAECFNAIGNVNFTSIRSVLSIIGSPTQQATPGYTQITAAGGARSYQFGAEYRF